MMTDKSIATEGNGGSSIMGDNAMDLTESTIVVDDNESPAPVIPALEYGEASFPSSEELRDSSTSRRTSRHSIWPGATSTRDTTATTNNIHHKTSRRRIWAALIVIAVIVLLVITPAVIVRNNQNDTNNEVLSNEDRPRPTYDDIVTFVVGQNISSESDVTNLRSSQSRAIYWLMNDDPANVPVPVPSDSTTYDGYMYMVRYVMALNYFAFQGSNWVADLNFMSEKDVCNWNQDVVVDDKVQNLGLLCATIDTAGKYDSLPILLHLGMCSCVGDQFPPYIIVIFALTLVKRITDFPILSSLLYSPS
jgi:hypothetical protein